MQFFKAMIFLELFKSYKIELIFAFFLFKIIICLHY